MTSQRAPIPQDPKHGSVHFWLMQARVGGHSALTKHSGLQEGGVPMKPWRQEQTAWLSTFRHWLLGPHGEGLQGSLRSAGGGSSATRHCENGSPVYPIGQEHTGMWLITSQRASYPHVPGHGSTHLFLIHALSLLHSVLSTHSGLQDSYGLPMYSERQVQIPLSH